MLGLSAKGSKRARKILEVLRREFNIKPSEFMAWEINKRYRDPFALLVGTILSQNTNDKNSYRAFRSLASRFMVTPEALSKVDEEEIAEAIKVGGLYRVKAKKIKKLAEQVIRIGGMEEILEGNTDEVRHRLLSLPGVGSKTADIVLLFHLGRPVIPVDTHVNRVSKRLGLASENADYEKVRRSLESLYDPRDYIDVHHLLIKLGRTYCKARKPLCNLCPLKGLCPYPS